MIVEILSLWKFHAWIGVGWIPAPCNTLLPCPVCTYDDCLPIMSRLLANNLIVTEHGTSSSPPTVKYWFSKGLYFCPSLVTCYAVKYWSPHLFLSFSGHIAKLRSNSLGLRGFILNVSIHSELYLDPTLQSTPKLILDSKLLQDLRTTWRLFHDFKTISWKLWNGSKTAWRQSKQYLKNTSRIS